MKYKIQNEFGEIVARVNDPIDVGHIYRIYGPPFEVWTLHNRLVYPRPGDSPEYDLPNFVSARVIERETRPNRKLPVAKEAKQALGKVPRYEVGPSWKDSKEHDYKARTAPMKSEDSLQHSMVAQ